MIQLDNRTLRQVQMTELELLCEVERICRKRDIHYNIIAGTMLGAVRHGGFIPWDDDADVAMLRPEGGLPGRAGHRQVLFSGSHRHTRLPLGLRQTPPPRHAVSAGTPGAYAL